MELLGCKHFCLSDTSLTYTWSTITSSNWELLHVSLCLFYISFVLRDFTLSEDKNFPQAAAKGRTAPNLPRRHSQGALAQPACPYSLLFLDGSYQICSLPSSSWSTCLLSQGRALTHLLLEDVFLESKRFYKLMEDSIELQHSLCPFSSLWGKNTNSSVTE